MKERYTGKLRCATCGDTESFEFNDDKSYEEVKGQIEADAEAYIRKSLEDTFKGNNFFKIK